MEKIPKSDWLEEKRLLSNADWHIGAGSRYTDVLGPRTPPELRVPESLSKLLSLGFVGEGRPNFDVKGNLRWILTDVLDRIPANASVVLMAERDDAMSAVLSEMYELLGHPKLRAIYTTAITPPLPESRKGGIGSLAKLLSHLLRRATKAMLVQVFLLLLLHACRARLKAQIL